MYLSRLAAQKEYAFMRVLHREGFPVPEPIAWSRHTVVMEFIDSFPLRMIESVPDPGKMYSELMDMIVQLANRGLIHGDFNEFNILVKEETTGDKVDLKPIVIDFPQTVSTNHGNAQYYFDRDVACIKRYFERRFKYLSDEPGPFFEDAMKGANQERRLDIEVEASGFSRKMSKDLDRFIEATDGVKSEADVGEGGEVSGGGAQESENDDDDEKEEAEEDNEAYEGIGKEDPQLADPKLAEQIDGLSVDDGLTAQQYSSLDFGLQPLPRDADADDVAEKVRTKKKASGWAI